MQRERTPAEEEKQKQLDQVAVRSPHTTIWSGRNEWHVKDRLFRFYCSQLNRYKQELLVAELRAVEQYKQRNNNVDIEESLLRQIRKNACNEVVAIQVGDFGRFREVH